MLQVPNDTIVRGNRAPIAPSVPFETLDTRERRLHAQLLVDEMQVAL